MIFLDHIWLIPLLPALARATMLFFGRQAAEDDDQCCLCLVLLFLHSSSRVVRFGNTRITLTPAPASLTRTSFYTWLGTGNGDTGVSPVQSGAESPASNNLSHTRRPPSSVASRRKVSCSIRFQQFGCCS